MDEPIRTYGAVGWTIVGLAVVVGSFTMQTLTLQALVAVLGISVAAFGGYLLRDRVAGE